MCRIQNFNLLYSLLEMYYYYYYYYYYTSKPRLEK